VRATKWIIYTVLIGTLPLLCRSAIYLIMNRLTVEYIFNEVDMVTFGLVLHVSNINELDEQNDMDSHTRLKYIGASIFLIIIFAVLLGFAYIAEQDASNQFNINSLKWCTGILCFFSLLFSYSIYYRKVNE
jgi:integral membrane sensor domain MASE1